MTSAARTLLLFLLPSVGLAACGEDASTNVGSTGTTNGGTGGSAAGTGGSTAGTGGTAAGTGGTDAGGASSSAGASTGGAAGGGTKPTCDGGKTPSEEQTLCFGPDGKSDTIERHEFEGGDFQVECPSLVREPGSACPTDVTPCGYGFCGQSGKPYGAATQVGDRCCYALLHCVGPNPCGRPLSVDEAPIVARLVSSSAWA